MSVFVFLLALLHPLLIHTLVALTSGFAEMRLADGVPNMIKMKMPNR